MQSIINSNPTRWAMSLMHIDEHGRLCSGQLPIARVVLESNGVINFGTPQGPAPEEEV